jgi:hypothetical protein
MNYPTLSELEYCIDQREVKKSIIDFMLEFKKREYEADATKIYRDFKLLIKPETSIEFY